ncbi:MAG: ABC transporter permease, partial [Limisphaerales bacterium]
MAVRRRSLLRLRWWSTALALLFGFLAFAATEASLPRGPAGAKLFELIYLYAFILCLLSGAFLTSDSISSEKRDGTLGLLFLSELKGHDVVLGKFVGLALNAFYCLLALLPVAALALILGGVTGGQFWRTALALAEVMFFSMTLGIC